MTDSNDELRTLLIEYDDKKWVDWIYDILYFGIAKPFNRLSPEGDVLTEVSAFLRRLSISPKFYENALVDVLTAIYNDEKDLKKIFRLLDVIVINKNPYARKALMGILFDPRGDEKFEIDSIKSKTLQALAYLNLDEESRDDIRSFSKSNLKGLFQDNIAALGNHLRFVRLNFHEQDFFYEVTDIVTYLSDKLSEKWYKSAVTVIEDKLKDQYYDKTFSFYRYFYVWLRNDFEKLKGNKLFIDVLTKFKKTLEVRYPNYKNEKFGKTEMQAAEAVISFLSLYFDRNQINNLDVDTLNSFFNYLGHHDGTPLVHAIAEKNFQFVHEHFDDFENSLENQHENTGFLYCSIFLDPIENLQLIRFLQKSKQLVLVNKIVITEAIEEIYDLL